MSVEAFDNGVVTSSNKCACDRIEKLLNFLVSTVHTAIRVRICQLAATFVALLRVRKHDDSSWIGELHAVELLRIDNDA